MPSGNHALRRVGPAGPNGQIVINIPATTLPRLTAGSSVAKKRDEFRSCDSIWSAEKANSKSNNDHGNCRCSTVQTYLTVGVFYIINC